MLTMDEIIKQANAFEEDTKTFDYNVSYQDISDKQSNQNFNNVLNKLRLLNLPNPQQFKCKSLSLEELKQYLIEILSKIYGEKYQTTIQSYNDLIKVERISNPYDVILEHSIEADASTKIETIHVDSQLDQLQLSSIANSYTSALLSKYSTTEFNRVFSNYHYKELLSILIEYIACFELSKLLKNKRLMNKHEVLRLQANSQNAEEFFVASQALSQIPVVNLHPELTGAISVLKYEKHFIFGSLISDIYAYRLLQCYGDDPQTLLTIIRSIIEGEKNIKDLLNYYGISLSDAKTTNLYYERLDAARKLSKKR